MSAQLQAYTILRSHGEYGRVRYQGCHGGDHLFAIVGTGLLARVDLVTRRVTVGA